MTPFGCILLIKSLQMSQLTNLPRVMPLLNKISTMTSKEIFTYFVWPDKHFIKKETLYCSYEDGGLR